MKRLGQTLAVFWLSLLALLTFAHCAALFFETGWPTASSGTWLHALAHAGEMLDLPARLQAPSWQHWLGTDALGRDLLLLLASAAAVTLPTAVAAVALGLLLGVPAGMAAAAQGGWVDEALSRWHDVLFAFPSLLLALLLGAALGPGAVTATIAIGVFNIPVFARFTRSSAQGLYSRDFIQAARLSGVGGWRIASGHVWPNLAPLIIVQASIQMAMAVGAEAALAYVGLGVQPPAPSWGRLLAEAQTLSGDAPWLAIFPGLVIALTVLAFGSAAAWLERRHD